MFRLISSFVLFCLSGAVFTVLPQVSFSAPSDSAAPQARFVPVLSFPGGMARPSPWCTAKPILVYVDRGTKTPRCHAIDVSTSHLTPWTVFEGPVDEIAWSPDGSWVVTTSRAWSPEEGPRSFLPMRSLTAFPIERSVSVARPEALAAGKGRVRFLWGCDGKIWFRESDGSAEWQSVQAPAAWKP